MQQQYNNDTLHLVKVLSIPGANNDNLRNKIQICYISTNLLRLLDTLASPRSNYYKRPVGYSDPTAERIYTNVVTDVFQRVVQTSQFWLKFQN
jgi:hypothetical protein